MSIGELRTHKTIDESDGIFTQNTGLPSSFLSVNHISNSFEKNGKSGNLRKKERKLNALKLYSRIPLNNIYVPNKYKYIIADGSKGEQPGDLYKNLIREAMQQRPEWIEVPNISTIYNFKWQPFSDGIRFDELQTKGKLRQSVNHLKWHSCISDKSNLFTTLKRHCEINKTNVFDIGNIHLIYFSSCHLFDQSLRTFKILRYGIIWHG